MASPKPLIRWFLIGPVYDVTQRCKCLRIEATRDDIGPQHDPCGEIDRARAVAMIGAGPVVELEALAVKPNSYASWGWRL